MKREKKIKPNLADGYSFAHLSGLKDVLLSEDGCPWDRAQTFRSLKKYLREEAGEVLLAIDRLTRIEKEIARYLKMKKESKPDFAPAGDAEVFGGLPSSVPPASARNPWSSKALAHLPEKIKNRWNEAIEELKLELGDLLLQPIFLAKLARAQGYFSLKDVIDALYEKLVRRHPHVFGAKPLKTSRSALRQWHELKRKEKGLNARKASR